MDAARAYITANGFDFGGGWGDGSWGDGGGGGDFFADDADGGAWGARAFFGWARDGGMRALFTDW